MLHEFHPNKKKKKTTLLLDIHPSLYGVTSPRELGEIHQEFFPFPVARLQHPLGAAPSC